ncbi:MAG TPA: nickel ABC transporter permease [Blastocatellia bacterium]|nr:nickel ABC transporter permease [Blastocatellia bacterium]
MRVGAARRALLLCPLMRGIAFAVVRRILMLIPVLWAVVTLVFLLIHIVPGDPARQLVGENASEEQYQSARSELGLDKPLLTQYVDYWKGLARGDWGENPVTRQSVLSRISSRYPATIKLAFASLFLATLVSIPLGVTAATNRGSFIDSGSTLIALLGISLPSFALGPLLILLFSVELGLAPVSGGGGLDHLILPAVTLGAGLSAILTRIVRSSVLEELGEDYVRTARAKGLPERIVIYKHVLKNGLIPVVTVLGLQFGVLLAGAIITERVFSWPGVGSLLVDSISERDYKLTQGCILVIAATYVLVNTTTDIVYRFLDPRIKVD